MLLEDLLQEQVSCPKSLLGKLARRETDPLELQVVENYRFSYVRYDALIAQFEAANVTNGPTATGCSALQRLLKPAPPAGQRRQDKDQPNILIASMEREVDRVHIFVLSTQEQLWCRLLSVATSIKSAAHEDLVRLRSSLDHIGQEVADLDCFMRHNVAACAYLAQLLDGYAAPGGDLEAASVYISCIERRILGCSGRNTIGVLLVGLSDAYEALRVKEGDLKTEETTVSKKWVPPKEFRRVTRKFWLKPSNVTKFKVEVLKNLPILVFGERQHITVCDASACLADQSVSDSGMVASVYFDNPSELSSYHSRLRRIDMASVARMRWYGERVPLDPHQQLFIEKKVHRAPYTNQWSTKERAPMLQKDVADFLAGVPPTGGQQDDFLKSTQKSIREHGQEPLLRTSYRRTAFQLSSNNIVRLSLDVDLSMVRESGAPKLPGDWCRDLSAPLSPEDVVHFPYAIVEVKLQAKPPRWLKDLVKSGIILPVPKFSKFLHGSAVMFQHLTDNTPHWFLADEEDGVLMTPASWGEMSDKFDKYIEDAAEWLFPTGFEPPPPPPPLSPGGRKWNFMRRNRTAPCAQQSDNSSSSSILSLPTTIPEEMPQVLPHPVCTVGDDGNQGVSQGGHTTTRRSTWPVFQPPPADGEQVWLGEMPPLPKSDSPKTDSPTTGEMQSPIIHGRSSGHSTPQDSAGDLEEGSGRKLVPVVVESSKLPEAPALGSYGLSQYAVLSPSMSKDGADSYGAGGTPVRRSASLVRTKVEPKVFFANERTFLQWLQISVLVMLTATSLLSGSSLISSGGSSGCSSSDSKCLAGKLSGAIIAPVALMFMAYALYMYKKRTIQILRRETVRYDDQRGPVVLVVILILVMLCSYILSLIWFF